VVDRQAFEATKAVVLNTGARSWAPPIPGLEGTPYWTNRQAIEAEEVPGSMIILGGARSASSSARCSPASGQR